MFDLKGQVAAITGASSGLGVQFAKALARQGADIIIMARRVDKLVQVKEEVEALGVKCLAIPCDVTSPEAVQAAADTAIQEFGKVDILINNAGSGGQTPVLEMSEEEWKEVVELDLNSVFRMCKAFGAHMVKAGYGRIINISSMYGVVAPVLPSSNYAAAKAGVINFTRTLANEWAPYGVTVNALCPGFFVTELTADTLESPEFVNSLGALVPLRRAGKEGELDASVIYLASPEASYVTGSAVVVDGGYSAI